ncbi:hypothetical protein PoB_001463100 [Plakobranchus ocellatus]|uniref:Uncharacterized protein n=1 Tax=Plakobranchus ocellatus TaxID=259542 RepID=A0AAV3YX96_9GAST|nr:hypothetical protein PoB_001463100 [Plakobranchus ocellatus]
MASQARLYALHGFADIHRVFGQYTQSASDQPGLALQSDWMPNQTIGRPAHKVGPIVRLVNSRDGLYRVTECLIKPLEDLQISSGQ